LINEVRESKPKERKKKCVLVRNPSLMHEKCSLGLKTESNERTKETVDAKMNKHPEDNGLIGGRWVR